MNTSLTACRPTTNREYGGPPGPRPASWLASRRGRRLRTGKSALLLLGATLLVAQTSRSVWDGVYTSEQASRGAAQYSTNCAPCHGTDLNGGESAPPLVGGEFLSSWNGLTVGDLFERIRISMPADRPGRLNREQNVDILAWILNRNQFPAGKAELERQTEVLKQIRIEPKP